MTTPSFDPRRRLTPRGITSAPEEGPTWVGLVFLSLIAVITLVTIDGLRAKHGAGWGDGPPCGLPAARD